MEQGRIIGNVGVLDIRNATEESVASIERIDNVGVVFVSRETAALAAQLDAGNVGAVMEAPRDARMLNGSVVFDRGYFKDQETPPDLVVNGQVLVEPDVPAEDIEKGLGSLTVNGRLIYPEHLARVLHSRVCQLNGRSQSYAPGDRLATGRLTLDEDYLRALGDSTRLVVVGRLDLPRVLPNDLLKRKLSSLHVNGRIRLHEENVQAIHSILDHTAEQPRIKVIPTGSELVERSLVLDNATLKSLPAPKLYCTGRVQVAPEVAPAILDSRLEALATENIVVCPADLKEVLSRKCNVLDTRAVFYEGDLWLVEDELELVASRFDFMEGTATLVVLGELTIAPDIGPKVLADRLSRVHNLGTIRCTREQMGAIQARFGISDGELVDSARPESADGGIVGYMVL